MNVVMPFLLLGLGAGLAAIYIHFADHSRISLGAGFGIMCMLYTGPLVAYLIYAHMSSK